ncbi:hypothetical protein M427DRAFT_57056 [Gonapodya prolifera JEL478]|uniref:AVL9/DENND6 domain-containing protein n=1 Tax=Gonapodya prolifera (strain JEL478) TaxID=1344416 RepID=A0A139AEP1_GONPJ|nr:hypothetical protein M427DRAFT_57056 [Gonapodya prolifera JEL478]|eukprot:KXS14905.1 hypothetical protein M427DRAFT_57056 [Gonapodya prolifera JEL478]
MAQGVSSSVLHVLVVGIHPRLGSVVEYAFPSLPVVEDPNLPPTHHNRRGNHLSPVSFQEAERPILPPSWSELPHFAIPDGLRGRDDQLVGFHLPPVLEKDCFPSEGNFGSTDRQLSTSGYDRMSEGRSRSRSGQSNPVQQWYDFGYHQRRTFAISCVFHSEAAATAESQYTGAPSSFNIKAVVLLLRSPGFGAVSARLRIAARALAASSPDEYGPILRDLYRGASMSLDSGLHKRGAHAMEDDDLTGVHLVDLVRRYKQHTLTLLKILLLQRKVVFISRNGNTEQTCEDIYALISTVPGLFGSLANTIPDDESDMMDGSFGPGYQPPNSYMNTNGARGSFVQPYNYLPRDNRAQTPQPKREELGTAPRVPLPLFTTGHILQPFTPIQILPKVAHPETLSFVLGTTSRVVEKRAGAEVIIDVDACRIEVLSQDLEVAIALTPSDRRYIGDIVNVVEKSPPRQATQANPMYIGSDAWVRYHLHTWLGSLLACAKETELAREGRGRGIDVDEVGRPRWVQDFGEVFVVLWEATEAFLRWSNSRESELALDEWKAAHPCAGTSVFSVLQTSLARRFRGLGFGRDKESSGRGSTEPPPSAFRRSDSISGINGRLSRSDSKASSVPSLTRHKSTTKLSDSSSSRLEPPPQEHSRSRSSDGTPLPYQHLSTLRGGNGG